MKKTHRYSDVRVVNPISDFHTISLYPNQGIRLVLDQDSYHDHISINSPNLIIDDVEIDAGKITYKIFQRYDFNQHWSSTFALGSIEVSDRHRSAPTELCVVLLYPSNDSRNIVTVANPDDVYVKIEPYQQMKVICGEPEWNLMGYICPGANDQWHCVIDSFSTDLMVSLIHSYVTNDLQASESLYSVNQFLGEKSKNAVAGIIAGAGKAAREHHFVIGLTEESLRKIDNYKKSNEILAQITLKGNCMGKASERRVYLVLSVPSKKQRTPVPAILPTSRDNRLSNILVNPSGFELIEFDLNSKEYIVELVQPFAFDKDIPPEINWIATIEEGSSPEIYISTLPDDYRMGYRFQRFVIRHVCSQGADVSAQYLGGVLFKFPAIQEVRRVTFWLTGANNYYSPPKQQQPSRPVEYVVLGKSYSGRPKLATNLKITSLTFSKLADGAKTISLEKALEMVNAPVMGAKKKRTQHNSTPTDTKPLPLASSGLKPSIIPGQAYLSDNMWIDPVDGDIISIGEFTDTLLRFSPPSTSTGEEQNIWIVRVLCDDFLEIVSSRSLLVFETLFLEMVVRAKRVIPGMGTCVAGSLELTSGAEKKKVTFIASDSVHSELEPVNITNAHTKLIPALSDSTSGSYRMVKQFQHRDGVLLKPEQTLYIKLPDFSPQWKKPVNIFVYQTPIPVEVYTHKSLNSVRHQIDRMAPWMINPRPLGTYKSILIRPVSNQQPHIAKILDAYQACNYTGLIPFAELRFVAEVDAEEPVETAIGLVEQKIKVMSSLYLLLEHPEKKTVYDMLVANPKDGEVIKVGSGRILRLSLPMSDPVDQAWELSVGSGDSLTSCGTKEEKGWFVMSLYCQKSTTRSQVVTLTQGSNTRVIYVEVS